MVTAIEDISIAILHRIQKCVGLAKAKFFIGSLVLFFGSSATYAAVVVTQRLSQETLSFLDTSKFSDGRQDTATTLSLAGAAGDSRTFGWTTPNNALNFNVVSFGAFTNTPPGFVPGFPNDTYPFTVSTATGGIGSVVVSHSLNVNAAPAGAICFVTSGIISDRYYLDQTCNPNANQSNGAPFRVVVTIPGNYTVAGTAKGNHQLISIGASWTIDKNFVLVGPNTVFEAHIDVYQGPTTANPTPLNLEYRIFGDRAPNGTPIPLPLLSMIGLASALLVFGYHLSKKH